MKYWQYAVKSGAAGVILILSLFGTDISKEGIVGLVIQGIIEGFKIQWLNFLAFILIFLMGVYFSYLTLNEFLDEEEGVKVISILSFVSMFLITLGISIKIDFIQSIGTMGLVIDLILLFFVFRD